MADSLAPNLMLNGVLHEAVDRLIQSGKIEAKIDELLEKMVDELLKENLRSYSDLGKEVGDQIQRSLKIGDMGLAPQADFIAKFVQRKLDQKADEALSAYLSKQLDDLLQSPPTEMKVSVIIEAFVEEHKDSYKRDKKTGKFTFILEELWPEESKCLRGYWSLALDPEGNKSKYQCAYRIEMKDWVVTRVVIDHADMEKKLFVGTLHNFERMLFQMYVGKTKIINDTKDVYIETDYPEECDD